MSDRQPKEFSPYRVFSRTEWARLRADTPMTLTEDDIAQLGGINERPSTREVEEVSKVVDETDHGAGDSPYYAG